MRGCISPGFVLLIPGCVLLPIWSWSGQKYTTNNNIATLPSSHYKYKSGGPMRGEILILFVISDYLSCFTFHCNLAIVMRNWSLKEGKLSSSRTDTTHALLMLSNEMLFNPSDTQLLKQIKFLQHNQLLYQASHVSCFPPLSLVIQVLKVCKIRKNVWLFSWN